MTGARRQNAVDAVVNFAPCKMARETMAAVNNRSGTIGKGPVSSDHELRLFGSPGMHHHEKIRAPGKR